MASWGVAWLIAMSGAGQFPRVLALQEPGEQVLFEVDGVEIARYHHGPSLPKPYIYPLLGPARRSLTRLGHPHDPQGHRHHRSIWVGHFDVNGANFWEEDGGAIIQHQRIQRLHDGPESALLAVDLVWRDPKGGPVLREQRTIRVTVLPDSEYYLDLGLVFTPEKEAVRFGRTPFGFLGVRVAKTMSVTDGGGEVRNSEGGVNEAETLWKAARWVDCSGPVTPAARNGVALFDHPDNPRFPTHFHVRDDGWFGTSFCCTEPYELSVGRFLILHYRLYAHGGDASPETIEQHWQRFAGSNFGHQ